MDNGKGDISHIHPEVHDYKSIRPQDDLSVSEAKEYWDQVFSGELTENQQKMKQDEDIQVIGKDRPRYIITRNESLENDNHPITGVHFVRKTVELPNGEKIEGVFPEFESVYDARVSENLYLKSDKEQFRECNKQLLEAIEANPDLKALFSDEQLEQIREGVVDGSAPDGFVWHHNEESGKIQLVDFETHSRTGHTGGRCLWGGGTDNR